MTEFVRTVYKRISRSVSPAPVRPPSCDYLCRSADAADAADAHGQLPESQPATDTDNVPVDYLSVRITISHIDVSKLLLESFNDIEYICYKHKGARTKKEHVHLLIPEYQKKDIIRKRLMRAGYTGNESVCYKVFHNGLLCGIQYASKEGTKPIVSGPFDEFISRAPSWNFREQSNLHSHYSTQEVPDRGLRDWQLTYSNLVPQAVRYAKINKLGSSGLKSVVHHMISNTRWRPSKQLICGGVPDFYVKDFMFRMGQSTTVDMDWFCQRN